MLKKFVVAAVLTTSSTFAFAIQAPYLGLGTGLVNNTATNSGSFRGMPFNVFAGYGATFNDAIYLGGEVFGNLGTMSVSNSGNLRSTYGYGASLMPGVMLADRTMVFGRAGVIRTRFSTIGETATGAQFGLGMQTSVTQNWDLRGEYDYSAYRTISDKFNNRYSPRTDAFTMSLVYNIN